MHNYGEIVNFHKHFDDEVNSVDRRENQGKKPKIWKCEKIILNF